MIRTATPDDARAINEIYNHYIENSVITFDVEPWNTERRVQWLRRFNNARAGETALYHALVAERDGAVVGFACNDRFRARAAYRLSTETTIYLAPEHHARGLGTALYENLFARIAHTELHRAYAVISLPNPASIQFHLRFGFVQIGVLHEVGRKFNRYVDTAWLEKNLK